MCAKQTDDWMALTMVASAGTSDHEGLFVGLAGFYERCRVVPDRITYAPQPVRVRQYSAKHMKAAGEDPRTQTLSISSERSNRAGELGLYVRDDAKARDYERRWTGMMLSAELGNEALVEAAKLLARSFRLLSGGMMLCASWDDASCEVMSASDLERGDATIVKRIRWDNAHWRDSHGALRRLYPLTIIGPELWAKLPPMPRFDPMPTVEEFGTCKLLRAWPTLCGPRDPEFLRGTRALRTWLWPYTIQNPADHVDNDPR